MIIEDLVGMELQHKKYGKVKVIGLDIDYTNMDSTKVKVQLKDRIALFSLGSLINFFKGVPADIINDVEEIMSSKEVTTTQTKNRLKQNLEHVDFDEFKSELNLDDWKRSKKFVVDFWWLSNSFPSPVVMDNKKIFISAKAACTYLDFPISKYYEIYMICNGVHTNKTLEGHSWRFAKSKEIDDIIKNYE